MFDNFSANFDLFKDKIGDAVVLITVGGATWLWSKATGIDKRFNDMQLDLVKNYVTKPELTALEDKLDKHSEELTRQIGQVNANLMTLTAFLLKDK